MASDATFTTPAALEQAARNYRELVTAACSKRQILAPRDSASVGFQLLDGKVLQVNIITRQPAVFFKFSDGSVDSAAPVINVEIGPATEAALRAARKIATREQYVGIDALIAVVRKQSAAGGSDEKLGKPKPKARSKMITIQRDSDGKISGAFSTEV